MLVQIHVFVFMYIHTHSRLVSCNGPFLSFPFLYDEQVRFVGNLWMLANMDIFLTTFFFLIWILSQGLKQWFNSWSNDWLIFLQFPFYTYIGIYIVQFWKNWNKCLFLCDIFPRRKRFKWSTLSNFEIYHSMKTKMVTKLLPNKKRRE